MSIINNGGQLSAGSEQSTMASKCTLQMNRMDLRTRRGLFGARAGGGRAGNNTNVIKHEIHSLHKCHPSEINHLSDKEYHIGGQYNVFILFASGININNSYT
jgi:hypothetical protein